MSTYHIVRQDGIEIGEAHARRRGAIGSAVIALVEGSETDTLRVIKRKVGFVPALRATLERGEDGRFDIVLHHDNAEPVAVPVEPVADAE